jgi:hypothetical protein
MYSKQEASQLREEFWTAFGRYMQPILSAEGEKINWVNYKTGVKHITFRMQAGKGALISIDITHPNPNEQKEVFEKFQQLRSLLQSTVGEEWNWASQVEDEYGKIISRIYAELDGVNIFNKSDWPALISFFKLRIIALDEFWLNVKPGFEI